MPSALMECSDYSEFQEALKILRREDDIIVNTLNNVLPTDSFHPNGESACKSLHENLTTGNQKRTNFIKNCINITTEKIQKLKEQRENNNDNINLSRDLRSEQTKLRMLQVELSVEDLIEKRSQTVFNEKCRRYFKPI